MQSVLPGSVGGNLNLQNILQIANGSLWLVMKDN